MTDQAQGNTAEDALDKRITSMALATYTRPAPFGAITTLNVVTRFETMLNAFSEWNAARKTRKALTALSDRHLEDIGLTRGDVMSMTRF